MFEDKTISFIGSGVMGEAMIRGLLAQKKRAARADYCGRSMGSAAQKS